jgi:hypothetical protein
MNIRAVAVVVFLVLTGGALAMHFRQQSVAQREAPSTPVEPEEEVPVPSKTGPHPKFVVVGETVHNFGVMEHMQEGEHEFRIRNEGQAPLKMVALKRDHTCQCTLGSLGQSGLQPGEETVVKMNWTIKSASTMFEHSAKIRTNDPENEVTAFRVRGVVGRRLAVKPALEITLGLLPEKEATNRSIVVYSEVVDAFEITKLDPSHPLIQVTPTPLNAEQLKLLTAEAFSPDEQQAMQQRMKAEIDKGLPEDVRSAQLADKQDETPLKAPEAKSGYELKVSFQPGFPVGKVRESLQIHTNIPNGLQKDAPVFPPLHVSFTGSRTGPVQITGTPGSFWSPTESILRLGRFSAKEGKKARLNIYVTKAEQDVTVTDVAIDPPLLKYEFRKDETFEAPGRDMYELVVEVPPGGAPLSRGGVDRLGSVVLQTNHPEAKTIKFDLEFDSF